MSCLQWVGWTEAPPCPCSSPRSSAKVSARTSASSRSCSRVLEATRRAEPQKALQGFIRNSIQVTRRDRRIRGPLRNLPDQRRPCFEANKKEHQNRGQPDPGRHHGDASSRPDIQPSGSAPAGQRLTESWNGLLQDRIHPRLNWMSHRRSGRPSWKASSQEEIIASGRLNPKKSAGPALGTPDKGLQGAPACSLTHKLSKQ